VGWTVVHVDEDLGRDECGPAFTEDRKVSMERQDSGRGKVPTPLPQ
jgi:hypothetical protein